MSGLIHLPTHLERYNQNSHYLTYSTCSTIRLSAFVLTFPIFSPHGLRARCALTGV
ncbi:hypothetical protein BDV38DRAFT_257741 [Aspergillus pseudotamarii]|uniref:Uncharacterized protein n=1 Tax=Aspergillus pseudotamarii TaxID=132259 RepID=A0A5N6SG44_ASPPS|nr:uncharacterized protein BDV38DRAFT_257741 [Aspergillus pseudotamarii]KAE8133716.1 hypothetical protein BDV38DRAFT_257741 [Aspergillus pseudotamarii]